MAKARRLKAGRWRIYDESGLTILRDPQTGSISTFESLDAARHWWWRLHPDDPPLREAARCARCGAYFGPASPGTLYAGRDYHPAHVPQAIDFHRPI
jgi:hypothetical protein